MLNRLSTIPQYHVVRMGQGDSSPEGRMEGQDPVEVRTPANSAACYRQMALQDTDGHRCIPQHPQS